MNGLAKGTRPCTFGVFQEIVQVRISGDSPSPSESGAGPESGFGSPASPVWWDLGAKSLTVTGRDHRTRPCGFGSPGPYI